MEDDIPDDTSEDTDDAPDPIIPPHIPPKLRRLYVAAYHLGRVKAERARLAKAYLNLCWLSEQMKKQRETPGAPCDPMPVQGNLPLEVLEKMLKEKRKEEGHAD